MLTISIKQIPLASFALAVNNVAIISNIAVRNNTPNNYERLKVKITFDPEFADTVVEHGVLFGWLYSEIIIAFLGAFAPKSPHRSEEKFVT